MTYDEDRSAPPNPAALRSTTELPDGYTSLLVNASRIPGVAVPAAQPAQVTLEESGGVTEQAADTADGSGPPAFSSPEASEVAVAAASADTENESGSESSGTRVANGAHAGSESIAMKPANSAEGAAGTTPSGSERPKGVVAPGDGDLLGTGGAKEGLSMKSTAEMDKAAEPGEKNLPGHGSFPGSGRYSPDSGNVFSEAQGAVETASESSNAGAMNNDTDREHPENDRSQAHFTETVAAPTSHLDFEAAPTAFTVTAPVHLIAPAGTHHADASLLIDRVTEAVTAGVVHLREAGSSSLSVAIKPDTTSELVVRIERRDGVFHAHVQASGECAWLDRHWDDLRSRLADHGVGISRGGSDGGSFAEHRERSPLPFSDDLTNSVFLPAAAPRATSPSVRVARRHSFGFESWA